MDRTQRQSWTFWSPPGAGALLYRPALGYLWLIVRLYIGWQWLTAGWHKLTGSESIGWVHSGVVNGKAVHSGDKLLAFWRHAVAPAQPGSMPQVGFGWYRAFLHALIDHHVQGWFAPLIAGSEFLVGVLLILGAFTAVAAGVGALLNFNYMLAGSASLNPVLFLGALLLLAAWRVAGYVGLDRWLLPAFGSPWQPGWLFRRGSAAGQPDPQTRRLHRASGRPARLPRRLASQRRRRTALVQD